VGGGFDVFDWRMGVQSSHEFSVRQARGLVEGQSTHHLHWRFGGKTGQ
jgi:hypothetical protein